MTQKNYLNTYLYTFIALLCIAASAGFKNPEPGFVLKDQPLSFTPKEFYFAEVNDQRSVKGAFAKAAIYNPATHATSLQAYDLQGGVKTAITQYLDHNLKKDKQLRPVIVDIKDFSLVESTLPNGLVEGKLAIKFSFTLKSKYLEEHLVDYGETLKYKRGSTQIDYVEPVVRQALQDVLVYFNNWINSEANHSYKLARGVKVNFTDHQEKAEDDTIYYSTARPLTWADFKAQPNMLQFDAEVFPSVGYTQHQEVRNGLVNLDIDLRVYVPKSACWVKPGAATDYSLNHEQRHFDIAKIVAERFKKKLSREINADNYQFTVNVEYLEMLREMAAMQKKYDGETHHGSDHAVQAQWDEQIDKELKDFNVKRS